MESEIIDRHDLAGLRIGLLSASVSRLGGGVFEAVVTHAEMIQSAGGEPVIFGLDDGHAQEDRTRFGTAAVHHAKVTGPAQIGFAPSLVADMLGAKLDILHLHGIWMYPSLAGALWAQRSDRPYVISPHGMLDPWITSRGKLKKAVARAAYERFSWRIAARLHALTEREAHDIRNETGRSDTLVIPNAGPQPRSTPPVLTRGPTFLYLGRIHPKKNIDALIEAWKLATGSANPHGSRLVIAGWGNPAHVEELKAVLEQAPESIQFVGPQFGEDKQRLLDQARFLILPSHSEGLPMVVLEGWAAGTPSIMTSQCNLPEGFSSGAAIECGFSPEAIAETLSQCIAMDAMSWQSMAQAALDLANGPFSAQSVAARWVACYRDMIGSADNRMAGETR